MFYYERVIIVGMGVFAYICANRIMNLGLEVETIEYDTGKKSILEVLCKRGRIMLRRLIKSELTRYLSTINEKCLCISVLSAYIFPPSIVKKPNLYIINYHNSLLPEYPGRNVEAWEIFNMEKETGVTWHRINEIIDGGDIIYQEKIPIENDYTAIKLLEIQNRTAFKIFDEIIEKILKREIEATQKNDVSNRRYYSIKDMPNDAVLDITWNLDKIYAFLRALDYGALFTLGKPRLIFQDKIYQWETYQFDRQPLETFENRISFSGSDIMICDGKKNICLNKYYEMRFH